MTIRQRQHLLAYLGYYVGTVDGIWGSGSRAAAKAFQQDVDITDDGIGGPETDSALIKAVSTGFTKPEPLPEEIATDINVGSNSGSFWDDIEYFIRDEFRCKCGGKYCNGFPAEPKEQLVRIADQLRKNLGVPVKVISGLRCRTWNSIQGGVYESQHMYGEAADIYASGYSQAAVEAELDVIGGVRYHYGITGSNNVHFDIPKGAR